MRHLYVSLPISGPLVVIKLLLCAWSTWIIIVRQNFVKCPSWVRHVMFYRGWSLHLQWPKLLHMIAHICNLAYFAYEVPTLDRDVACIIYCFRKVLCCKECVWLFFINFTPLFFLWSSHSAVTFSVFTRNILIIAWSFWLFCSLSARFNSMDIWGATSPSPCYCVVALSVFTQNILWNCTKFSNNLFPSFLALIQSDCLHLCWKLALMVFWNIVVIVEIIMW